MYRMRGIRIRTVHNGGGDMPKTRLSKDEVLAQRDRIILDTFTAFALRAMRPASQALSVLDIGCGNGVKALERTEHISKHRRVMRLTGIDTSREAVGMANRVALVNPPSFKAEFIRMDALNSDLPETEYDVVTAEDLIIHLPLNHLATLIAVIGRVMKRGGVFLAVGDPVWPHARFSPDSALNQYIMHTYLRRFTAGPNPYAAFFSPEIMTACQEAGLDHVQIEARLWETDSWDVALKLMGSPVEFTRNLRATPIGTNCPDEWAKDMRSATDFRLFLPYVAACLRR